MPAIFDVRRAIAAFVAVMMSAALIAFALVVSGSFRTQMQSQARLSVGDADAVVTDQRLPSSTEGGLDEALVSRISGIDGVSSVRGSHWSHLKLDLPPQLANSIGGTVVVQDVPVLTEHTTLTSGRLPSATGEVLVSTDLAEQQGLGVGDTIRTKTPEETTRAASSVVGVISPGADSHLAGTGTVYATTDQIVALGGERDYRYLYVTGSPGNSPADLREKVAAAVEAVQPSALVQTADEEIFQRASNEEGSTTIATVLNLLAPVCAIVAMIVIATTFTTLVARQTRTIGLLRCVGASRGQVLLAIVRTGLLTGVISSVLGAGLGVGSAAILIRSGVFADLVAEHLTISPLSVALAIGLGSLTALIAVLRPARRATRISPLVALTGQSADVKQAARKHRWVAAVGAVIVLVGGILAALGATGGQLPLAAGGSALTVAGFLAMLPFLTTAIAQLVGNLGSPGRFPILHLAIRNLIADSGRSAATTSTFFVCVLVGSALFVGLFSLRGSFDELVHRGSPVDVQIHGITPSTDVKGLTSTIASVNGVEKTLTVPSIEVTRNLGEQQEKLYVVSIDKVQAATVVRSTLGLEDLSDDTLIVGDIYHIPDGTQVTLTGPGGQSTLTARVREGWGAAITPATAQRLTAGTPTDSMMWIRTSEDSSGATEKAIREASRGQDLMVVGSAAARAQVEENINRMIFIVCLVIGAAFIISLSGMANTIDVSVLERTREIGVLRATGSSRSEIKRLIITEGVLLAVVGGTLGLIAGSALGAADTLAALKDGGITLVLPLVALAGIFGVTLLVAVSAALVPAGRASAVAPVAALAED
ncbi:FtsX-like permease family protein [Schaalia sp. 19OD2882]|uniref:FtsX-like permease family protein n=1 Tax=Schaalia sp. 19OD2882 TaxID=2794089 RepID=UPI001C1ECC29|nr:FtsX-like permease family protein [Schaalia sp. 19OD2882]QWW20007.1 FtsX-like permease family protein [Schaalia sp. 19OD2882]